MLSSPNGFGVADRMGKRDGFIAAFCRSPSGRAVAMSDYSAKELTVAVGERGRVIRILDGWAFVELHRARVGWMPERVLNILKI
jgi:hypothetical protein